MQKLFSTFVELAPNCDITRMLHLIKVWWVQTFFEVTFSIFSIESIVVYTKHFSAPFKGDQLIVLALVPTLLGAIIAILYVMAATSQFAWKLRQVVLKMHETISDPPLCSVLITICGNFFYGIIFFPPSCIRLSRH